MDLDLLSWNCRGICNDTTSRALKDLIVQHRPQVVFLCETKISREADFERLRKELGFAHAEPVLSEGRSGGLGLFWTDEVKITIGTSSAHHIDAVVEGGAGFASWRLTGFYGYAATADRDKSWQLLRDLADLDSLPWVIIGDFNEILNNDEKIDGPLRPERQMRGFRDALGYGDLLDLGFHGEMATWGNSETLLRLDRGVCTATWFDIFHHAKLFHLPPSDSDHVPLLLKASTVPLSSRPKVHRFQFEPFWLQHEDCDKVVKKAWDESVEGVPMYVVAKKIIKTRWSLDKWQREVFRGRQVQMMAIRTRLEELMGCSVTTSGQEEKKQLFGRLQNLLHQEEMFWKQRSKVLWLKEGDRNTNFFHKKAESRRRKKALQGLFDCEGNWRDDDQGLENVVTEYFASMFQASPLDMEAVTTTLDAIAPMVSLDMNNFLTAPYSADEIKCAVFQMYPTKSPGLDGMPPLFFQHYWELIGSEVVSAVQDFFQSGKLLKEINYTHVCLIPKVDNPEHMSDLRPIALCNVIYKICSKAIANRLKILLPEIISPFQSAFVPGRLITDNILVANELAHFVHNKRDGGTGYMALQLDLSKAYDRMEWGFLERVMRRLGFDEGWIKMVMQCVSTVRYSFLIRGRPRGYLTPSRGLRQGDPLYPYLFLLGAEGFSALLQKSLNSGSLPGIAVCENAPRVNHLLFADDSMLYAEASSRACAAIQKVLTTYGRASGQLVNLAKCSVVFSKNVVQEHQDILSESLGMEVVSSHEKYLGLPTYVGRNKSSSFQYIKERLEGKLSAWQGKMLSGAGKDILIRVVAQALPNFAMSVFKLSQNFCEDLEQMCARFWWGSSLDHRKIHWKRWNVLCNPKESGGLGFRSLSNFNTAMLSKQAWRIVSEPTSLVARLYKAKYFPQCSFWEASEHSSPSFSWRSIFGTRDLVKSNSHWQVGRGDSIKIFSDNWIPGSIVGHAAVISDSGQEVSLVSELMADVGVWDEPKIRRLFSSADASLILQIPLSRRSVADRLCWKLERDGKFAVKSSYGYAFYNSPSFTPIVPSVGVAFWKKLWKAFIPSKAKVHIWRVCLDILPSMEALTRKRVDLESNLCVLCGVAQESTLHLCRDCPYTQVVLQVNPVLFSVCLRWGRIHADSISWLVDCANDLPLSEFGNLLFMLWSVWKERNERVWNQKSSLAVDISCEAAARLAEFRYHNKIPGERSRRGGRAHWKAPPEGVWKINTDGAFHHVDRSGGAGFVVRDFRGCMVAGGATPLSGLFSAEHVELMAVCRAVDFAISQGFFPLMLETDAQMVQQQLGARSGQNTSHLGRIYDDLRYKLDLHGTWKIGYTKRDSNSVAHCMAAKACVLAQETFFFSVPNFLQSAVAAEVCTV